MGRPVLEACRVRVRTRVRMVDVGPATVILLIIITLIAGFHFRIWSSLCDILIIIIVFCIVILVHVFRDCIEEFSQK
jgi:hypothetical protein